MDKQDRNLVEEIVDEVKDGVLDNVSWLDILTGLGYGAAAFLLVSFGYITHQADKKATINLLINNKEEN